MYSTYVREHPTLSANQKEMHVHSPLPSPLFLSYLVRTSESTYSKILSSFPNTQSLPLGLVTLCFDTLQPYSIVVRRGERREERGKRKEEREEGREDRGKRTEAQTSCNSSTHSERHRALSPNLGAHVS